MSCDRSRAMPMSQPFTRNGGRPAPMRRRFVSSNSACAYASIGDVSSPAGVWAGGCGAEGGAAGAGRSTDGRAVGAGGGASVGVGAGGSGAVGGGGTGVGEAGGVAVAGGRPAPRGG